jgi:tight adherence protein B
VTNPLLLALGAGVMAVILAVYFLVQALVERRRRAWEERAKYPGDGADSMVLRGPREKTPDWDEQIDKTFEHLVEGSRVGMAPDKVLAAICLGAVLLGGALYLWRGQPWLGLVGGLAGLVVPVLLLAFLQGRARAELQEQLPDFLFLLARSLRAGMNLEQALELAIAEDVQPLSGKLQPVLGHLRLGLPLTKALEKVAENIQLLDFHTFVSVVSFYRVNGGNLGMLLDRLGNSVRDRNQFRGHLAATTAQARFTALLVGLAGPLILAGYGMFQPEHVMPFFQSAWGWGILVGALALEGVAATVLYQILRVDY